MMSLHLSVLSVFTDYKGHCDLWYKEMGYVLRVYVPGSLSGFVEVL